MDPYPAPRVGPNAIEFWLMSDAGKQPGTVLDIIPFMGRMEQSRVFAERMRNAENAEERQQIMNEQVLGQR